MLEKTVDKDTFVGRIMNMDRQFFKEHDMTAYIREYIPGEFSKDYQHSVENVRYVCVIRVEKMLHIRIPLTSEQKLNCDNQTMSEEDLFEIAKYGIRDEFIQEEAKEEENKETIEVESTEIMRVVAALDEQTFLENPENEGFARPYIPGEFGNTLNDLNIEHVLVFYKDENQKVRVPMTMAEFALYSDDLMAQKDFDEICMERSIVDIHEK